MKSSINAYSYNTNTKLNIQVQLCNYCSYSHNSLYFMSIKLFNKLPMSIQNLIEKQFKNVVKILINVFTVPVNF